MAEGDLIIPNAAIKPRATYSVGWLESEELVSMFWPFYDVFAGHLEVEICPSVVFGWW